MTKDDIIRMAVQCNLLDSRDDLDHPAFAEIIVSVEKFAELVAAHEREKAAAVCESACWTADIDEWIGMTKRDVSSRSMRECAAAIRRQS